MTITLLLVLAGALAVDADSSSPQGVSAPPTSFTMNFKSGPVLGHGAQRPLFQPFALTLTLAPPSPNAGSIGTGMVQLQNHRTGVTCTMRILQVTPSADAGILRAAGPELDPIVSNSASPCVE